MRLINSSLRRVRNTRGKGGLVPPVRLQVTAQNYLTNSDQTMYDTHTTEFVVILICLIWFTLRGMSMMGTHYVLLAYPMKLDINQLFVCLATGQ
jgi:hypothetical protein